MNFSLRKADNTERSGLVMKDTNKNFLSVIRRTRINGSPGNGTARFVEYEIACQIRLLAGTLVEKEIIYKWTVWKRFSQFLLLHKVFIRLNSFISCLKSRMILICMVDRTDTSHNLDLPLWWIIWCDCQAIQKNLGWLMKSKTFPPSRTFVYDKTSLEFVEKRRYWRLRSLHLRFSSLRLSAVSLLMIILSEYIVGTSLIVTGRES